MRHAASTPAERLVQPFQRFLHLQASGGILLLACTVIALIWANGPWGESYVALWKKTEVTLRLGDFELSHPLYWWVNDALMAVFFFVVGLEIKREILVGELSTPRQAALPVAAALGGMVFPALFYVVLNGGGPAVAGWGIPMATDIAFAIGILSLLGPRVPLALKVFLTALAIADDLGAVLVIAFFYTSSVATSGLLLAGLAFAGMGLLNFLQVRGVVPYLLGGIVLWIGFVLSGVHPTVGGVLAALTIPARQRIDIDEFLTEGKAALRDFESDGTRGPRALPSAAQREALGRLDRANDHVEMPIRRLEDALHPWVSFLIMPLFALANAGVKVEGGIGSALASPVAYGIILGLVLGKPIGIFLFSWVAVRLRIAELPRGVGWAKILAAGSLAGIGFTMSIFIAGLAFEGDDGLLRTAKLAILVASLVSGVFGSIALVRATKERGASAPGAG